jgi:hypothetical protein
MSINRDLRPLIRRQPICRHSSWTAGGHPHGVRQLRKLCSRTLAGLCRCHPVHPSTPQNRPRAPRIPSLATAFSPHPGTKLRSVILWHLKDVSAFAPDVVGGHRQRPTNPTSPPLGASPADCGRREGRPAAEGALSFRRLGIGGNCLAFCDILRECGRDGMRVYASIFHTPWHQRNSMRVTHYYFVSTCRNNISLTCNYFNNGKISVN